MADVIIKGFEMPKDCSVCELSQKRVFANSVMCPITRQTVGYYDQGFYLEDHNCPLIPLPEEHGRLGDLDALLDEFTRSAKAGQLKPWSIVKTAPTIIPAEGGNTNGN